MSVYSDSSLSVLTDASRRVGGGCCFCRVLPGLQNYSGKGEPAGLRPLLAKWIVLLPSVQFSRSVVSDSLRPHELQPGLHDQLLESTQTHVH